MLFYKLIWALKGRSNNITVNEQFGIGANSNSPDLLSDPVQDFWFSSADLRLSNLWQWFPAFLSMR
jgi:hypothetical protein